MHVLYFVQYFPPEKSSGSDLVQNLLEGFAEAGWKVDVYTPTPTRGVDDKTRQYYIKHRISKLYKGHVVVHRMSLYREGKGVAGRALRYLIFSLECYFKALKEPAEVVFTGSGPPSQGWIIGNACRKTGKKLIYNLQDIFPDSLVTSGICDEDSFLMKIGRKIEAKTYKNAMHIITITDDMKKNVLKKGVPSNKVSVVRNWIDTDKVRPVAREDNKLFDELGLSRNFFYVVYAGNIGRVQGLDVLIEAAEKLKDERDIHFVIFGNGSEEEYIKDQIKKKKLKNVSLFPLQSMNRVSEVYSLGDVNFISCRPGTGRSGMPSKTWTIMACASPIIASFDLGGEMEKTIKEAQCGICVEAGKSMKIVDAIKEMSNDFIAMTKMGMNARSYVKKYVSRKQCVEQYIKIISEMAGL